jgi:Ni/Fe-hydrogenase 1 B-type cytochrome subunit
VSTQTHRPPTHPDVILSHEKVSSVKVWQPLIRVLHWSLVSTIVVLSVTGLYIGNPAILQVPDWNLMATVRLVHLLAAWIFIAVIVARVVLAFTGNPWARWDQFVPVSRRRWRQLVHSVLFYAFLKKEPAIVVGHNPLAGLAYVGVLGMALVEIVTGIALMGGGDADGLARTFTGWLVSLTNLATLRMVHHIVMWLIWVFAVIHVYLCLLIDRVERNGEVSSMFGGWKELPTDRIEEELRIDAGRRRARYLRPRQ